MRGEVTWGSGSTVCGGLAAIPTVGEEDCPMKRKRFSTEQIVMVLKQHEMGMPVQDLIRQVGITEQT